MSVDARCLEQTSEAGLVFVAAGEANDGGAGAQSGDIHRDIGCAPRLLATLGGMNHWHRRLGRNTVHAAVDVLVQHDVADNENVFVVPAALQQRYRLVELRRLAARFMPRFFPAVALRLHSWFLARRSLAASLQRASSMASQS